jgi:hypothetical protein
VDVLEGPMAVLGVVLVVSGVMKLADTAPTEAMFGAMKLPDSAAVVRCVALYEIVVGVGVVVFGGRVFAALVGASYAVFTVVSASLLARGERSVSCGCFGRSSATISPIHVAVDAVATVVAVAATIVGVPSFFDIAADLPGAGVPQALLILLSAALTIAVLTVLPETMQAARRTPASARAGDVPSFGLTGDAP